MAEDGTRIGQELGGKYRLVKLLGGGGMGEVYKAEHRLLGRTVAIKIMRGEYANNPEWVERFLREAQASNMVKHPNVVEVVDIGRDSAGVPYMVQEYLEGNDLAHFLTDLGGRIAHQRAIEILLPVIEAVGVAHKASVVHRDLKPENVFLARVGSRFVPKVLDFGISRINTQQGVSVTSTGMAIGTPAYMSPEQVRGNRHIGPPSDVWSLGVMLYEVLGGQLPFLAETPGDLFVEICTVEHAPLASVAPHIPPDLCAIVERCLRKPADERFASAVELARALQPFLVASESLSGVHVLPPPSETADTVSMHSPGADAALPGKPPRRSKPDSEAAPPPSTPTSAPTQGPAARPSQPGAPTAAARPSLDPAVQIDASKTIPPRTTPVDPSRPRPPKGSNLVLELNAPGQQGSPKLALQRTIPPRLSKPAVEEAPEAGGLATGTALLLVIFGSAAVGMGLWAAIFLRLAPAHALVHGVGSASTGVWALLLGGSLLSAILLFLYGLQTRPAGGALLVSGVGMLGVSWWSATGTFRLSAALQFGAQGILPYALAALFLGLAVRAGASCVAMWRGDQAGGRFGAAVALSFAWILLALGLQSATRREGLQRAAGEASELSGEEEPSAPPPPRVVLPRPAPPPLVAPEPPPPSPAGPPAPASPPGHPRGGRRR